MTDVLVPGARDVRASLDGPEAADAAVVACPPHPQMGGDRSDRRLRAVGDALADRGIATLRFDYGGWDEGYGEREDARNAVRWAADEYDAVGLFGYSFGGAVALLAAAGLDGSPAAVSALAPAARLGEDLDAAAALSDRPCPCQVIYGSRDDTADWAPLVERARDPAGGDPPVEVVEMAADHHFVGQTDKVAATVADFLAPQLG